MIKLKTVFTTLLMIAMSIIIHGQDTLNQDLTKTLISKSLLQGTQDHCNFNKVGNALGYNCIIGETSVGAFAEGIDSEAIGRCAFAAGDNAHAKGIYSIAIGKETYAGDRGVAIGSLIGKNDGNIVSSSFIIGEGIDERNRLINNKFGSLAIGFKSTVPTLFVGTSNNNVPAGIITNTGSIGIGTDEPQYKLHILSNIEEEASIFLQPANWEKRVPAGIYFGNVRDKIMNDIELGFLMTTPRNIVLESQRVGINTTEPQSDLHIFGDYRPQITLSNQNANLIIAIAEEPWDFAPGSQPDDVVFKTHSIDKTHHHGIIFNMNDDANDGTSYIKFNDNKNHKTMIILNNGRIGMGTTEPEARLQIYGSNIAGEKDLLIGNDVFFTDINVGNTLGLYGNNNSAVGGLKLGESGPVLFGINNRIGIGTQTPQAELHVAGNSLISGTVGIGSEDGVPEGYLLAVGGDIICEKVKVQILEEWNWPDFVFSKTYKLNTLDEVEKYIVKEKHLPNMPSAAEVEENGIDLGKMDAKLLEKIEELTLYMIELKKENNKIIEVNEELKKRIEKLENK